MAETAIKTARAAQVDADSRIADTAALAEGESEAFRAEYPTRIKFPYRLEDKAHKWPFLVEGMWHDGQFTYLRSNAQESPALYEEKDGKPSLVAYDLGEDGLYVARHVLGPRLVTDRQTESTVALRRAGDRPVIEWKRLYMKPAGSLPGGVVTQWGVGAITVFILLFLTYWIVLGGGETAEVAGLTEVATTAPRSFADQMTARVDAETMRAETNKAAQARALKQQQQQEANVAGLTATHQAALLAGPSPDTGQPYTEEEWQLRRACDWKPSSGAAVRFAVRRLHRATAHCTAAAAEAETDSESFTIPPPPAKDEGAEALQHALNTMHMVTTDLEDEIAAEAETDKALLAALTGRAITPEAAPTVPAPTATSAIAQDHSVPARLEIPQDPPGWERIYEGSFLEAIMATQLTGDFPARCWPWLPFPSTRRIGNVS